MTATSPETTIYSLHEAAEYFDKVIMKGKARPAGSVPGSRGSIAHVFSVRTDMGLMLGPCSFPPGSLLYMFFKRAWLREGDHLFDKRTGGPWQSVNLAGLKRAADKDGYIVVVMPDGETWAIGARAWWNYSQEFKTIRRPSTEPSLEASVPRSMLSLIKPGGIAVQSLLV